jgi:hypothetical protein
MLAGETRRNNWTPRRHPEMNSAYEIKNIAALRVGVADVREKPPIILAPYEEAVGTLHAIDNEGGGITARIGPVDVLLPHEMAEELNPHLGLKIGIIRVDDSARPYRVRICR